MTLQTAVLVLTAEHYLFCMILQGLKLLSLRRKIPSGMTDIFGKRTYSQWTSAQTKQIRFTVIRDTVAFLLIVLVIVTHAVRAFLSMPSSIPDILLKSPVIPLLILASSFLTVRQRAITEKYSSMPFDKASFLHDRYLLAFVFFITHTVISVILLFSSSGPSDSYSGGYRLNPWIPCAFVLFIVVFRIVRDTERERKSLIPLEENKKADMLRELVRNSGVKNVQLRRPMIDLGETNAYALNLFGGKTIVFHDALLNEQDPERLYAVAAHEIGHLLHPHTFRKIGLNLLIGASLFLAFYQLIPSTHSGLINPYSFSIVAACIFPGLPLCAILWNRFAQQDELAADAYAARAGYGEALKASLKNRNDKQICTLNPLPIYHLLVSDHPTISKRIDNIDSIIQSPQPNSGSRQRLYRAATE